MMDTKKLDHAQMKSIFKHVKKFNTNFTEEMLTLGLEPIKQIICDDKGQVDVNKFSPDEEYRTVLLTFLTILATKQANQIYNTFFKRSGGKPMGEANVKATTCPECIKREERRNTVKIPNNWKVVQGGKQDSDKLR